MSDFFKILRMAAYVLALPLAVTAAVSAHQQYLDNQLLPKTETVLTSAVVKATLAGTFRHHTIAVDQENSVRGRITAIGSDVGLVGLGKTKVMLVRDGNIDHLIETQADGSFQLNNVEIGDYSLIATGKMGFSAFGVRVVDAASAGEHTTNVIEVATVNPESLPLRRVLETVLPMKVLEQVEFETLADVDTVGSNRVRLQNGKLTGRLTNFVASKFEGTKVALLSNDQKVAEIAADEQGQFSFENVVPGVYQFVAAGKAGFAVLSFEAVEAASVTQVTGADGYYFASAATEAYHEWLSQEEAALEVATTMPQDSVVVQEQMGYIEGADVAPMVDDYGYAGTEIGCGAAVGGCCGGANNFGSCCGGGGMGGGFGGFGGAGLAGVARMAILGWILTELFDEIDFSNPNPPSPAN